MSHSEQIDINVVNFTEVDSEEKTNDYFSWFEQQLVENSERIPSTKVSREDAVIDTFQKMQQRNLDWVDRIINHQIEKEQRHYLWMRWTMIIIWTTVLLITIGILVYLINHNVDPKYINSVCVGIVGELWGLYKFATRFVFSNYLVDNYDKASNLIKTINDAQDKFDK